MTGGARGFRPRQDLLVSPVLAACLALLVLNDHVFKDRWPGVVTGKLSDVAGVAMVALVLTALTAHPRAAFVATAGAFTLLKTSAAVAAAASPVLGGVTRTDPTDLIALLVLVPLWRWVGGARTAEAAGRWLLPLKVVSLCGVAIATSATSCDTQEVYRVDTVAGVVVATTDDGTFESTDGGATWQPRADVGLDTTSRTRQREVCLDDGKCLELTASSVVRVDGAGSTTEFSVSERDRERLADADSSKCGLSLFGSIVAVEQADGEHVVVSMGAYGALHRTPAGVWEWSPIGDYGRDNPLTAGGAGGNGQGALGDDGWSFPFVRLVTVLTPVALALAAIPLSRLARRNGRRAGQGAWPVLIPALVMVSWLPGVTLAPAFDDDRALLLVLMFFVLAAVVIVSVTAFFLRRPRAGAGGSLPPPAAPAANVAAAAPRPRPDETGLGWHAPPP